MQHEEAIVQELQRRNDPSTVEVWGANLRMLHRYLMDQEKGTTRVWQEIHAAQQQVAKVDLGQGVLVDPTTGEKFQKTTRRR
jgi:hypothetical protein